MAGRDNENAAALKRKKKYRETKRCRAGGNGENLGALLKEGIKK